MDKKNSRKFCCKSLSSMYCTVDLPYRQVRFKQGINDMLEILLLPQKP